MRVKPRSSGRVGKAPDAQHPSFWALPVHILCIGPVKEIAVAIAALNYAAVLAAKYWSLPLKAAILSNC
jgi:hypothetical protein